MSTWESLVTNQADNLIFDEEYKALFGYPNGKYNFTLGQEVPGTSRINIFQNQIFSDDIPDSAPSITGWTATTVYGNPGDNSGIACGTKYENSSYPSICYYDLSLNYITTAEGSYAPNSPGLSNAGRTYWTTAANTYGTNATNIVANNFLNLAIPGNYDPVGSYFITVTISDGSNTASCAIGNNTFPWTLNTNSGILLFTGNNLASNANNGNNSLPNISWQVSITFWAYKGSKGSGGGGGDTIWTTSQNPDTITPISTYQTYTITGAQFKATSDYRIKTDIHDLDSRFHNVDNLRPVIYKQVQTNNVNIGLIAHELQEYFPFLVDGEKDGEKTQAVNYIGLIGVLIKEIQDLKKRVNTLESEKKIEEIDEMK